MSGITHPFVNVLQLLVCGVEEASETTAISANGRRRNLWLYL